MKKIILLLLVAFFSLSATSQNFDITKSEIFKDKKKNSFLSYSLNDGNGGIITIRGFMGGFPFPKLKGYYIQHFDADLKLVKEYNYEVKKSRVEGAFIKDGKLNLIEFYSDKKKKSIVYNAVTSSLDKFNFTKKEILSFSEDNVRKYFGFYIFPIFYNDGVNQKDRNHLGEVVFSQNKNFFVVNFDVKNKDKETHKVFVFNNNFELVLEKLITKNIKDRLFEYNSIEVDDNDGTVYFLGKSYENNSKRKKRKGKANYHFELYKVTKNDTKVGSFKFPDKFISSLELVNRGSKISCIGFYGNNKEHKVNGICLFNLDKNTLDINLKKFTPFSDEFLADKYGNREGKKKRKKKKGITNIEFRSIELLENGDLIVSAEEDYITTHTTMMNGAMSTRTVQHYDDIIAFRLNKNGDLKWSRNINKRQTGYENSSFTSLSQNNGTHFFINCSDNIRKLSANRLHFRQTSAKRSNLYVVTLSNNGDFDYKKLIDDKESKVFYKVNQGIINLSKKEVIFLGKRKKKSRILKIAM